MIPGKIGQKWLKVPHTSLLDPRTVRSNKSLTSATIPLKRDGNPLGAAKQLTEGVIRRMEELTVTHRGKTCDEIT
jgi:hypothetical protein